MKPKITFKNLVIVMGLLGLIVSPVSFAQQQHRPGTTDFSFVLPYTTSLNFGTEGGAGLDIDSDVGFGIGFSYNIDRNLAFTSGLRWNSAKYEARYIEDSPGNPIGTYRNSLDTFDLGFGVDYYFGSGNLRPFIGGNIGWSWIDSNIAAGPPGQICWWDPYWGYRCGFYQNTYSETNFFYGGGLGLRLNLGRNNFAKLGYYNNWMDLGNSSGQRMESFRAEFGWSF